MWRNNATAKTHFMLIPKVCMHVDCYSLCMHVPCYSLCMHVPCYSLCMHQKLRKDSLSEKPTYL